MIRSYRVLQLRTFHGMLSLGADSLVVGRAANDSRFYLVITMIFLRVRFVGRHGLCHILLQ